MKQSKKEMVEFAGMRVCVHVHVWRGRGLIQVKFTVTLSNITPLNIF